MTTELSSITIKTSIILALLESFVLPNKVNCLTHKFDFFPNMLTNNNYEIVRLKVCIYMGKLILYSI